MLELMITFPAGSSGSGRDETPLLLLGESGAATRLRDQIRRVAGTPQTTVLVTGERGFDLGALARVIHDQSSLGQGPFLLVDCLTLDQAMEELADGARGGTLFLHEVSALDAARQDSLLAFLETRVGQDGEFRLIASTSHDLEARANHGSFREDLLYRLNVLTVRVPALRQRVEDVPELVSRVLRGIQRGLGTTFQLQPDALDALVSHSWSGNLLELETVVGIAALRTSAGSIGVEHLDLWMESAAGSPRKGVLEPVSPPSRSLRDVEEATIRRVLSEEGGNRSSAARVLGINRTTLYNKIRLYGLGARPDRSPIG